MLLHKFLFSTDFKQIAIDAAIAFSNDNKNVTCYVIQSSERYYATNDDFIRRWERLIGSYTNGKRNKI